MQLSGTTALVTGASKGIGAATALELARRGAMVIVHYYSDENDARQVRDEIKKRGGTAHILAADLRKESERVKLADAVRAITKKLDILVNNAGIFLDDDGPEASDRTFTTIFSVNTTAAARLCTLLHPLMPKDASVINIGSIHGTRSQPHTVAYGASKAALHAITQALAHAWAPIRVNTISPGPIDTPMWANDDDATKKTIADEILLKRFGRSEEVAKVVAFLASSDASYITGANISVDGGRLLH